MNEPGNFDEGKGMNGEAREVPAGPISPDPLQARTESERAGKPWKRIVVLASAGAALVGAAVAATLAATHRSAVRENGIADLNGFCDGVDACTDDFGENDERDPDEDDCTDEDGESLSVSDAADIWLSSGMDEDHTFGYDDGELKRAALD